MIPVNQFKNRHKEEYHQSILEILTKQGPIPPTILAYRAEMNDSQVQIATNYLLQRKLIEKTELTNRLRTKLELQWSLSSKRVYSITDKGRKYLEMLEKLQAQIDWKLRHND